jgi:predicted metal-dependent phosphoesterase TrpH
LSACQKEAMHCVLGVELGVSLGGAGYHMLAYNFDRSNRAMLDLIARQKRQSDDECEDMIRRMSADFSQVSVEGYRAYTPPVDTGGWKYIHYAVAAGAFATYEEAGATIYPNYMRAHPETCTADRFCSLVKCAGGIPILAHPGDSYSDKSTFHRFLEDMRRCGIGGVECYYPTHDEETTAHCIDFCKTYNLRITGGSDCHGEFDDKSLHFIGAGKITRDMLNLCGIA